MASYRDILVHLDGGLSDAPCTEIATQLARRYGARLTGLFARTEHYIPSAIARRASEALQAAAATAEQVFLHATQGLPARYWRLSHGDVGHVISETLICARVSDLLIMGRYYQGKDSPQELVEQAIIDSGRPCLIVPEHLPVKTVGDRVMIAWNGGREATRVLHDSMPLLETASCVDVVTIRHGAPSNSGELVPPVSILDHLSAHGVRVHTEILAAEDIGIMDLLLSRAYDQDIDLLVMGAHGGYQLPFFKGAGTRYILDHLTVPVLMAH